jgi:hypothetical protein
MEIAAPDKVWMPHLKKIWSTSPLLANSTGGVYSHPMMKSCLVVYPYVGGAPDGYAA